MRITKLPELEEEEKLHGFQLVTDNYVIDLYLCFSALKFYCNYDKNYKDLAMACGIFMVGITNLNREW